MSNVGIDIGTVTMSHSPDMKKFSAAFFAEDEVGSIIRCHFEAERAVEHVLSAATAGRYSQARQLKYLSQKLEVLRLFGVHENFLNPVELLNKDRNAFAHKGKEQISDEEVQRLHAAVRQLSPIVTDDFRVIVNGKRSFDKPLRDCTNIEKYVALIMISVGFLSALPNMEVQGA